MNVKAYNLHGVSQVCLSKVFFHVEANLINTGPRESAIAVAVA